MLVVSSRLLRYCLGLSVEPGSRNAGSRTSNPTLVYLLWRARNVRQRSATKRRVKSQVGRPLAFVPSSKSGPILPREQDSRRRAMCFWTSSYRSRTDNPYDHGDRFAPKRWLAIRGHRPWGISTTRKTVIDPRRRRALCDGFLWDATGPLRPGIASTEIVRMERAVCRDGHDAYYSQTARPVACGQWMAAPAAAALHRCPARHVRPVSVAAAYLVKQSAWLLYRDAPPKVHTTAYFSQKSWVETFGRLPLPAV